MRSRAYLFLPWRVFLLAIASMQQIGCQTATSKLEERERNGVGPQERVYFADYDAVQLAVSRTVLNRYMVQKEDSDAGIYESQFVRGSARYKPPHKADDPLPAGYQYRILVRYVRVPQGGVKVQVTKKAVMKYDILSTKDVPSDGLEEQVILYRIGRELAHEKMIKRIHQRESKAN